MYCSFLKYCAELFFLLISYLFNKNYTIFIFFIASASENMRFILEIHQLVFWYLLAILAGLFIVFIGAFILYICSYNNLHLLNNHQFHTKNIDNLIITPKTNNIVFCFIFCFFKQINTHKQYPFKNLLNTILYFYKGNQFLYANKINFNINFFFELLSPLFSFQNLFQQIMNFKFVSRLFYAFFRYTHNKPLECGWTLVPICVLGLIGAPSFIALYAESRIYDSFFTIKVIGHQWYWSFEWLLDKDIQITENMPVLNEIDILLKPLDTLSSPNIRLLETNNVIILPINLNIRFLITSADVLHSFAIPALGLKMDACPGRLNQFLTLITHSGIFYGQCSELCGVGHGFMPITLIAIPNNILI